MINYNYKLSIQGLYKNKTTLNREFVADQQPHIHVVLILRLVTAIGYSFPVVIRRAIVSATFQGSLALIVVITVPLHFLTEPFDTETSIYLLARNGFFSACLLTPITQEISLTIFIFVTLFPFCNSCNNQSSNY